MTTFLRRMLSEVNKALLVAIGTGLATGILAALTAFWILVSTLPGRIGITPTGAVMAFDITSGCPSGWASFVEARGRSIVGSATQAEIDSAPAAFAYDSRGVKLSPRLFRQAAGEEAHVLTEAEMPAHQHITILGSDPSPVMAFYGVGPANAQAIAGAGRSGVPTTKTSASGQGAPHNNLPPSVALTYCRKN